MPKPDRSQVTKATRVALVLDIVVPEGMEKRGEDEVLAYLYVLALGRAQDDPRDLIECSEGDVDHIPEYIWEDWERTQQEGEA